jgi:XTP/dITP diphosphohydrolase
MLQLVLATNNVHKISEISHLLAGKNIQILSAVDFKDFPVIAENGQTLYENAIIKASAIWNKYRLPCLADDTGLEVDSLNGLPGVFSARFAGENCTYDDNNRKLLRLLEGTPHERRTARFKTVMAFLDMEGIMRTAEGVLEGHIALSPIGNFGFGYDPVFIVKGFNRTLAQFTLDEKNKFSHRGQALKEIIPRIIKSLMKIDS